MKPIHTVFIVTVLAACVFLIPYIGFWFLPVALLAMIGMMIIHSGISGKRPTQNTMGALLVASIVLTLFALLQGLNVQRCLTVSMAEKGVLASEVKSCRVFGMYHFPGSSSGRFADWPASGLLVIILPSVLVVLSVSLAYLLNARIHKSEHDKDTRLNLAVAIFALILLILSITIFLPIFFR